MALEHNDAPRFTPEQRDEILNLASRLQSQHGDTVGADELLFAAQQAGIDPRFVQEAAMRLGRKSQPISKFPLVAFCLFTFQAFVFMFTQNIWLGGFRVLSSREVMMAAGFAFVLSLFAARDRAIRRYVPLASIVVWITVEASVGGLTRIVSGHPNWSSSVVANFCVIQTVAALAGIAAAALLDRTPESSQDFRLRQS